MNAVRAAVATALAVLLLAGCTGGSEPSSSGSPSAAGSGSTSATASASPSGPAPTVTPAPAAPALRACYLLTSGQLTQPTSDAPAVPCRRRHTARTIYVGKLVTAVDGHSVAVDSATVQRQLSTTCPRKLAQYVGGSAKQRDLSRFNVVWYSPTLQQSDQGADWFRCDLIAFAGTDTLAPLPQTRGGDLKGVLARPGALDTYGLCGTAAPGAPGFQRVICGQRHSWRAIDTIGLSGGARYPGVATVRRAGDAGCKALARARAGGALTFKYGWEWPTAAQWSRGQRFGYCWAPA